LSKLADEKDTLSPPELAATRKRLQEIQVGSTARSC
jgi:hypothetical protein